MGFGGGVAACVNLTVGGDSLSFLDLGFYCSLVRVYIGVKCGFRIVDRSICFSEACEWGTLLKIVDFEKVQDLGMESSWFL